MTTKTSTTEETALATWDDPGFADEAIEGVYPIFPEIRLVQKATPAIPDSGKHGGEFWFSDDGTFAPSIQGIIVLTQSTCAMWDERDRKRPVCASDDARRPRPNQPLWEQGDVMLRGGELLRLPAAAQQPESCAACPFFRRECGFGFTTLFEHEDGRLYRMRWKGTAATQLSRFLGQLKGLGVARKARSVGRPSISKVVHIRSEEQQRDDFIWYVPRVEAVEDVDAREAPLLIAFRDSLRAQFQRTVEETHAADELSDANGEEAWPSDVPAGRMPGAARFDDVPLE